MQAITSAMTALAYPQFRLRSRRLATFVHSDIEDADVCAQLCSDGFFYEVFTDTICCIYCGNLEAEDKADCDLLTDHLQHFPKCSTTRLSANFQHPLNAPINLTPIYSGYMDYIKRRNTFTDNWPLQIRQKGDELAANGFYYTGYSDHVRCFQEGCLIKNWKTMDRAGQRHLQENPGCVFALACRDTDIEHNLVFSPFDFAGCRPSCVGTPV